MNAHSRDPAGTLVGHSDHHMRGHRGPGSSRMLARGLSRHGVRVDHRCSGSVRVGRDSEVQTCPYAHVASAEVTTWTDVSGCGANSWY